MHTLMGAFVEDEKKKDDPYNCYQYTKRTVYYLFILLFCYSPLNQMKTRRGHYFDSAETESGWAQVVLKPGQ